MLNLEVHWDVDARGNLVDADANAGEVLQRLFGDGRGAGEEELALVEADGLLGLSATPLD